MLVWAKDLHLWAKVRTEDVMPTKANGLLYADYTRAMKARERFGAKKVRVYLDGSVEFSFGDEGPDPIEVTGPEPVDKLNGGSVLEPAKVKLHW